MHSPIVKFALILCILVLGWFTYQVNIEVNNYQDVHKICSKAVDGFPTDKLGPLARSGKLNIQQEGQDFTMSNNHCSCTIKANDSEVFFNHGTSCQP